MVIDMDFLVVKPFISTRDFECWKIKICPQMPLNSLLLIYNFFLKLTTILKNVSFKQLSKFQSGTDLRDTKMFVY